jgi:hypothetical protein
MKNLTKFIALVVSVCATASLISFKPAGTTAANVGTPIKHVAPVQAKGQPFCQFTYIDQHGRSTKMTTNSVHATPTSLTFIFDDGERLVMNFGMAGIKAGHYVADSRPKDLIILFYGARKVTSFQGVITISSIKPGSGNFSYVTGEGDDHIILSVGTFAF